MKTVRLFLLATLVVSTVAISDATQVVAQGGDEPSPYTESDCSVPEEFLNYVETHGGLEIFGYPLSNPFRQNGILVQYFQNARVEAHPDHPIPYKVQLGLLGDELNYRNPPIDRPRILSPRRHFFPETGHIVSYAFLEFFRENGGIDVFGYPITEMYYEDGRIVQYFQRMKLAWYPEDRNSPVHVGNLGEIYFDTHREAFPPEAFCRQSETPTNPRMVSTELRLEIDVAHAVMTERGAQTVYVLVKDGNGALVPYAQVDLVLKNRQGQVLSSATYLRTNEKGFVQAEMAVTGASRGDNITAEAEVSYDGLRAVKDIVFLIWW